MSSDRSDEAGPLEKRPTILGTLIRLMNGVKHTSSRDTACELIWALCGSDRKSYTSPRTAADKQHQL
jgi:hypothetical protein